MKKIITLLIIIVMIMVTGCVKNDSSLSFEDASFELNSDVLKHQFSYTTESITTDDNIRLMQNPLQYENGELLTNSGKLVSYDLEDMVSFESDNTLEIDYVDLTEIFSTDVYYNTISNRETSVLIDYENSSISILENNNDNKTIIESIKLKNEYSLKELKFLGGYKDNTSYIIALKDSYNTIHFLNMTTMKVEKKYTFNDRQIIQGYNETDYSSGEEMLYVFLLNKENNELTKLNLVQNKEVYTKIINEQVQTKVYDEIEGELIKFIPTHFPQMMYLLTKEDNGNNIYNVLDNDFNSCSRVGDHSFENVDNIFYYGETYLVIFNKQSDIPLKLKNFRELS